MTHAEQFLKPEAIEESFIRASGPGGQNVNKVASAVQLRFFPERAGLPPRARRRLLALAGSRATQTGTIVIEASNSGAGVAPALQRIESNLVRQFAQFSAFTLDSRHTLVLTIGEERSFALPGGGRATIQVEAQGAGAVMVVSVPGGTSRIESGGLVFVGAGRAGGGGVILAIQS